MSVIKISKLNVDKNQKTVRVKILPHGEGLPMPSYATQASVGVDLMAAVSEPVTIKPLQRAMIPTGISIALPEGYEGQVRPRSGLAAKNGITVLNSPGTIDPDYRGEVCVILVNLSDQEFTVERGMRIAQMVVAPFAQAGFVQVDDLDETARGSGGFGSTGV